MHHKRNPFSPGEIFVNEIILTGRTEVSLFGFIKEGARYIETRFVFSRNLFRQMLRSNGTTGLEILHHIEEAMKHPHQQPLEINLVEIFGTTQSLQAGSIQMQLPFDTRPMNNVTDGDAAFSQEINPETI